LPGSNGGAPGDLYAVVRVDLPAQVGERERELYAELAKLSKFDPRKHLYEER
jgi:curved DNA-binding protein